MRQETLPQTPDALDARRLISVLIKKNFLPHIVRTAAEAGIALCFVRVGRIRKGQEFRGARSCAPNVQQLRSWIEGAGCVFIDTTGNKRFTPDMYLRPDDDHIGPWAKEASTKIYADELRPLLAR